MKFSGHCTIGNIPVSVQGQTTREQGETAGIHGARVRCGEGHPSTHCTGNKTARHNRPAQEPDTRFRTLYYGLFPCSEGVGGTLTFECSAQAVLHPLASTHRRLAKPTRCVLRIKRFLTILGACSRCRSNPAAAPIKRASRCLAGCAQTQSGISPALAHQACSTKGVFEEFVIAPRQYTLLCWVSGWRNSFSLLLEAVHDAP